MANFDVIKAIFSQVDTNKDGSIDLNEFRNWAASAGATGGLNSFSYGSSTGEFDTSSNLAFSDSAGFGGATGYEAATSLSSSGLVQTGDAAFESSNVQQSTQYASVGGLYNDPNPQIMQRAATGGPITYQQKILVRFLQPPPVPPPGPLIIKEVRPPQPPPPPPFVVRQRAPPLPQPPPLILRERPPIPPAAIASQTIIRRLAAIPVPPRSVIIERLPPLPPKPRDIIIERWVPYGAQAKRRTIVQRAAAAKEYPKPRNIVIIYDAIQSRVIRQFQRLGVTSENPQAYLSRYGASLLDAATLVQQARTAGVIEDISPPAVDATTAQFNASTYDANAGYDYSSPSSSQNFSSIGGATGFEGLQVLGGIETGTSGLGGIGESYSSQSYSSLSSYGTEGTLAGDASFAAADTNRDGSLDQAEFQQFVQGGF